MTSTPFHKQPLHNMLFGSDLKGGLERADGETGQLIIRHPETKAIRIINVSPQEAQLVHDWAEARKANPRAAPMIQDALGFLDESIRQQILDGYIPEEFDSIFKEVD